MRSVLIAALLVILSVASVQGRHHKGHVKVAPHIQKLLDDVNIGHERYFPDYKYEGFATPHEEQPAKNLNRRGSGPHDVIDVTQSTPNPHMANKSWDYPKNVQWLLNMFESGLGVPRSYNDILLNGDVYWATKTYLSVGAFNEYGQPTELDSMITIQERTLTRFGLNLYDAATWQIALSLWNLHDVAYIYEENILYPSTTGPGGPLNGAPGGLTNIRADNNGFQYGPKRTGGGDLTKITYAGNVTHFPAKDGKATTATKTGPGSFYYRMIGPYYIMTDPMNGNYGNAWKFPWPNYDSTTSWNTFGEIHFNDWKPITGENVWSAMLGPIQSLGLATNGNLTNTTCGNEFRRPKAACDWSKFETIPPSIQQGISIIPALLALQDETGSLFHCPWGSKIFPPDPDEGANLSNENNFSSYASINMFYEAIKNYTNGAPTDKTVEWAYVAAGRLRDGLSKWFDSPSILSIKGQLPNGDQVVPQGGHLNHSGYFPVPINTVGGLAMDCQTWGMTVMTRERVDKNFGQGTAYNIWQNAKKYAGYYKGGILAGVGYTDLANSNGSVPVNDIWSAEWTFGAINMCQIIGQSYIDAGDATKGQDMLNDAQSMYSQVTMEWPQGLRFHDGSYVYANKRFFIPWGWFSNPISATCSTAWSVMQARNFDPFHYGGGNKPALVTPPHLPPGMQ